MILFSGNLPVCSCRGTGGVIRATSISGYERVLRVESEGGSLRGNALLLIVQEKNERTCPVT
ncbi:hypothetical protein [Odoribacter sp. AF15-53]|uniref:hypothetical protein n=1 Tax=Odoribacter sp. AF15-53 TaxID=2292236 RepID=UPI001313EB4B|nr:hypothetical protein [Odoribacter sp. AF15-53]